MTNILQLDSSATGDASVTSRLNALVVETVGADATVVRRDVSALPSITTERFAANSTSVEDRTPEQRDLASLGDDLIVELELADVVVIAAPIYNFGVPSGLKSWMDLVARAGRTFRYTETGPEGQITNTRAIVVTASGGVPLGSAADFSSPHITTFLQFLGIDDITQIDATGLMMNPGKISEAETQVRALAVA